MDEHCPFIDVLSIRQIQHVDPPWRNELPAVLPHLSDARRNALPCPASLLPRVAEKSNAPRSARSRWSGSCSLGLTEAKIRPKGWMEMGMEQEHQKHVCGFRAILVASESGILFQDLATKDSTYFFPDLLHV